MLYRLSYKCILVYRVGIEPTTYGLRVRRSTAELPVHYLEVCSINSSKVLELLVLTADVSCCWVIKPSCDESQFKDVRHLLDRN